MFYKTAVRSNIGKFSGRLRSANVLRKYSTFSEQLSINEYLLLQIPKAETLCRTKSSIYDRGFCKIANELKSVTILPQKLHHRSLTGF